eukprot:sb/3476713/
MRTIRCPVNRIGPITALCFIMLCFPAFRQPFTSNMKARQTFRIIYITQTISKPLCLFCKRHPGEGLRPSPGRGKNEIRRSQLHPNSKNLIDLDFFTYCSQTSIFRNSHSPGKRW